MMSSVMVTSPVMEGLVVGREVNEDRSHVEKSGQHEGQCPNAVCVSGAG